MGEQDWKNEIKRITDEGFASINMLWEKYSGEILAEINRLKEYFKKNESEL